MDKDGGLILTWTILAEVEDERLCSTVNDHLFQRRIQWIALDAQHLEFGQRVKLPREGAGIVVEEV